MLFHVDDGEKQAGNEGNLAALAFHVASGKIEGHAGQGGSHLQATETRGCRGCFAVLENSAADSAPCPVRMYEKSANLRGIVLGIEEHILTAGALITPK